MSEDYKILEVRMFNYRQYYGSVTAKFASSDSRFAAIIGRNGVGKSNLLNAINWCLFHKEPHTQPEGQLPIINTKCIVEAENESKVEMSVSIILEQGKTKYNITRKLLVIKHELEKNDSGSYKIVNLADFPHSEPLPAGFEKITNQTTEMFQRSVGGGPWEDQTKSHRFDTLVNNILPKSLSEFFLLDGEFLERFFTGYEKIAKGVKQISQLNILEDTLKHINILESASVRHHDDASMNVLESKIKQHQKWLSSLTEDGEDDLVDESIPGKEDQLYHRSGIPRLNDLKTALAHIEHERAALRRRLYETNRLSNAELQVKLDECNQNLLSDEETMNQVVREHGNLLVNEGPKIMLTNALIGTNKIVDGEIQKGELPNHIKLIFTEDLLSREQCICGTGLQNGTPARSNVEYVRDTVNDDLDLDVAADIKYANGQSLNQKDAVIRTINNNILQIEKLETKTVKTREQIREIKDEFVTGADDNYLQLNQQLSSLDTEHLKIYGEIGNIQSEVTRRENDLKSLRRDRSNLEIKDQKAKRRRHEMLILDQASDILRIVCSDFSNNVRNKIQEKTTEYFKKIMWKDGFFDRIEIDEYYRLRLFTESEFDAIDNLAAGEKLFLAFSFVAALREITGYRFPLVIDSPLGKIAGVPRRLLANRLPDFLPDSQLVLLVSDTEYLTPLPTDEKDPKLGESFRELLIKKVTVCESVIGFDKDSFSSSINLYDGSVKIDY